MTLSEILQAILEVDLEDFVWGWIDDTKTSAYVVVNTEKPNTFIITIQEAKIEAVE